MPKLTMPGALLVGDAGGMVDTVALKGVHHCIRSGMLAAEAIYRALKAGERRPRPPTRRPSRSRQIGQELCEVRNTRQPFQKGFLARRPAGQPDDRQQGPVPRRALELAPQRRAADVHRQDARTRYPKPDGKYTFDKLSSVFITGNATRDDAPNHIRVQKHVPREVAETWAWMCPAGVYEIPDDAPEEGPVDVMVNYTNCVQCGAITAKGGRLTTPEGGDGPLYQIT